MATIQQILNDVDLRYRNTFTVDQKLVWYNEEVRELFEILEIDSEPYAFVTVEGENFYPFPPDFDVQKIKTVTFQIDGSHDPKWEQIDFYRNDDTIVPSLKPWWTIISDTFYLHVHPQVPGDRTVYIYCDKEPKEVTSVADTSEIPKKYQEILKLGILKRIAMARKDVTMYNNYSGDYEQKIADILWEKKMKEPEWTTPLDVNPKVGDFWYGWMPGWRG